MIKTLFIISQKYVLFQKNMSKRHNGDGAQPYIYHNPSHVYNSILDATKHCNVNKTISYTIDLVTTQKTYILNNVFLNNIFLSPLPSPPF
jgi:hypothetical protein